MRTTAEICTINFGKKSKYQKWLFSYFLPACHCYMTIEGENEGRYALRLLLSKKKYVNI